ncbi:hypothetical protein [Herbaspirillum sp. YR522]|nr:hypothetical protein [Herbaspirillum sp. YR522]EJM99714.1 hypothetical protein PMI40_03716 [Herbaspirillum sp. YR522]
MRNLVFGFLVAIAIQVQASESRGEIFTAMVAALESIRQTAQVR